MAAEATSPQMPRYGSTGEQQEIQRLKEELAKSREMKNNFLCRVANMEIKIRKYAEQPVVNWSDDCECRVHVAELADMLKNFLRSEEQATNVKAAATFPAPSGNRTNPCVSVATTQTEAEVPSRQKNCAEMDNQHVKIQKLETTITDLSRLVKKHQMRNLLMKENMENTLEKDRREVQQLEKKFNAENRDLILKNRAMREELSSYNEKRDDLQRAKAQVTAIRLKYYKETEELQHQVKQLREQLRCVNERQTQHTHRTETEHHSTSRTEHHSTSRTEHRSTSRTEHHHKHNHRHVPRLRSQVNRLP